LKAWYTAIENQPNNEYKAGSEYVKNLRLKIEAKPASDFSVVVMPEIAGNAFTLLDAYVAVKRGPVTLTGGQFSVPFSQDYTTSPAKLWSVDNSSVTAYLYPFKNRDQGIMGTYTWSILKVQAALVQGLGINITPTAQGYATDVNNVVGRVEIAVPNKATIGAAWYSGRNSTAATSALPTPPWGGSNNWQEISIKCDKSPINPNLFWKAEWLNNTGSTNWGLTYNLGFKTGLYKTLVMFERYENNANHFASATSYGAGITRDLGNGLSLSIQANRFGSGPSHVDHSKTRTVAQVLAEF
jgi:hypothetical protein